uniref:Uncharacterized protein n=1 Tax=Pipistrellus kuhlii TaxID=59472 RepID=A0A7J7YWS6_PIPKU|nr:hypothetical protein mPipKuh1_009899 [Pipistrellus kuhlii]
MIFTIYSQVVKNIYIYILYNKSIICKSTERQNNQSWGGRGQDQRAGGSRPAKVHASGQRKGTAMGRLATSGGRGVIGRAGPVAWHPQIGLPSLSPAEGGHQRQRWGDSGRGRLLAIPCRKQA